MNKNAFVIIHFGNNVKYFEFELYFLKNLKLYTTKDIIYMYSITDTPDIFIEEVGKIATHVIGYDDSSTTYNAVAPTHYTQFSAIRTCNFIYAYTLTQYDKICIVESDLIITKNIDNIFLLNTPSVSYFFNNGIKKVFTPKMLLNNYVYKDPSWILKNCNEVSIINGGVILDKPSLNMFEKYKNNLQFIIEYKCKYPNESLFSYTNPKFYNLPVKYNCLHYNLSPQKLKDMNLNMKDICIVHFNETKYKYLDIIKDNWLKNMMDTEHNKNKRQFIIDFKNKVYDVYYNELNNILIKTTNALNKPESINTSVTDNKDIYKLGIIQEDNVEIGVYQMTVINKYDRALSIAKKNIENLKDSFHIPYKNGNNTKLPFEVHNKKWRMTMPALENTLKYLFEKLHHSCYMLCVKNNNSVIYKLEVTDASPTFEEAIKTRHLPMLQNNKLITEYQKNFITKELQDPVRIMQCILKKPYKSIEMSDIKDLKKSSDYHAYTEILHDMKLPNGVFILNLTDAVILTNNGMEPFPMVTGNVPLGKYDFNEYIPIMSMSGQVGYSDIPIPNYDDISIFNDNKKLQEFKNFNTIWKDKKINKAVFRGGPSGCGYTPETNMRLKLALMKFKFLDVELTGKGRTIDSRSIKFDPVYGLGMLNTNIKPATSFLTMTQQSNYKYIIHIDGNVNAHRLLTTMRTGSLIIRVSSPYISWFDHLIKPDVHYVMVRPDLSDLESCIEWCMDNDSKCKEIAKNGLDFAISVFKKDFIKSYFQKLLWSLSDYQNISTPDHPPPGRFKPVSPDHPPPGMFKPVSPDHPPPGMFKPVSPDYPPPGSVKSNKKLKTPSPKSIKKISSRSSSNKSLERLQTPSFSSSDKSLERLQTPSFSSSDKSLERLQTPSFSSSDKSLKSIKKTSSRSSSDKSLKKTSSRSTSDKSIERLKTPSISSDKSLERLKTPSISSDKSLERLKTPSSEYIELKGKQCPKGYKGVTHKNKKMCKKNKIIKTRKEPIVKIKTCKDGKELNPNNRCVNKCKDGYTRRIEDFKCIKNKQTTTSKIKNKIIKPRKEPIVKIKTCDDGKELNPKNRCVKKCKNKYTRRLDDFKCIRSECDDDKELNPKNRCVKKCKNGYTRRMEDFKCIKNK